MHGTSFNLHANPIRYCDCSRFTVEETGLKNSSSFNPLSNPMRYCCYLHLTIKKSRLQELSSVTKVTLLEIGGAQVSATSAYERNSCTKDW